MDYFYFHECRVVIDEYLCERVSFESSNEIPKDQRLWTCELATSRDSFAIVEDLRAVGEVFKVQFNYLVDDGSW